MGLHEYWIYLSVTAEMKAVQTTQSQANFVVGLTNLESPVIFHNNPLIAGIVSVHMKCYQNVRYPSSQ